MLKLNKRDISSSLLTVLLPEWLGPGDGVQCFVDIEYRPAGDANPKFVELAADYNLSTVAAGLEQDSMTTWDERYQDRAKRLDALITEVSTARAMLFYDACVVTWKTNIQNDDKDLEPTRENFLMLAAASVSDLVPIFSQFMAAAEKAGHDLNSHQKDILEK